MFNNVLKKILLNKSKNQISWVNTCFYLELIKVVYSTKH